MRLHLRVIVIVASNQLGSLLGQLYLLGVLRRIQAELIVLKYLLLKPRGSLFCQFKSRTFFKFEMTTVIKKLIMRHSFSKHLDSGLFLLATGLFFYCAGLRLDDGQLLEFLNVTLRGGSFWLPDLFINLRRYVFQDPKVSRRFLWSICLLNFWFWFLIKRFSFAFVLRKVYFGHGCLIVWWNSVPVSVLVDYRLALDESPLLSSSSDFGLVFHLLNVHLDLLLVLLFYLSKALIAVYHVSVANAINNFVVLLDCFILVHGHEFIHFKLDMRT